MSAAPARHGQGAWQRAGRRLLARRAARWSAGLLLLLLAAALIVPQVSPYAYDAINKGDLWLPPLSRGHLLGTDALGRDLLARLAIGLAISLAVGVVATLVSLVIGVSYGAVSGYVGGRVDELMMRAVDALYALPFIFFVILLMVTFGKSFVLLFVAIGAVEWLTMARIVRGQTMALKNREFIEAARAIGLRPGQILWRHVVPNLLGPVVVYATLTIPGVILAESFLSFLGLGVQEPMTSLGTLISEGARDMEIAPWLLVVPSIVMAATLLAFNVLGDALRDALDPKDR